MIVNKNVEFDNIKIYNGNCNDIMDNILEENSIDIVLTSPPYNNSRTAKDEEGRMKSMKTCSVRYDVYTDDMPNDEYCQWTVNLFNRFDRILKPNGIVIYNISYGSENVDLLWLTIADIVTKTNFQCADCIVWKKPAANPNSVSPNKLTRITEFVFIFCRRDEFETFNCNKKVTSVRETGQKMYQNVTNFIEAKNNDETCPYNKATYSSELCEKLLRLYAPSDAVVYDPFMGTGTTAVACERLNLRCFGSELSENQIAWANDRLEKEKNVFNPTSHMAEGEMSLFTM